MELVAGGRTHVLQPGDAHEVPPGTPHIAAALRRGRRDGPHHGPPAGRTEAFLERLAAFSRDGRLLRGGWPRPTAAAELVRDFGDEGHAAKPPVAVQRAAASAILAGARVAGTVRARAAAASGNEYLFVDEWDVAAPPHAVFAALADARTYPPWWTPVYIDVEAEGPPALGKESRQHFKGRLPYHLHTRSRITRLEPPHVVEGDVDGDLRGRGTWTLTPTPTGTHVRFDWRVYADRPLLRTLTPVLRPAFRWNHAWAIARAIDGLEPFARADGRERRSADGRAPGPAGRRAAVGQLIAGVQQTNRSSTFARRRSPTVSAMHQSTLQTVSGIPGAAAGIDRLLDAALDCIVTMDARGEVVGWNSAAEETFGYRREEAIGRPLGELIVPEPLREAHARGLARYLAGGDPRILGRRIELTACRADGTELPVELTITRVEGEPPVFAGYLRDISRRRELERQLELRLEQQSAVAALGEHALRAPLPDVIDEAVALVAAKLELDRCHVWESLPGGERLLLRAGTGWDPAQIRFLTVPMEPQRLPGYTLVHGGPVLIEDFATDGRCRPPRLGAGERITSALTVSIPGPERPFGVIAGWMEERRAFTADDASFLRGVANVLSAAIQRDRVEAERLREALTRPAHRPAEPHAPPRPPRAGARQARRASAARSRCCSSTSTASRRSTTASATRAATACSSRSPSACERVLRPADTVARFGGDEFVVLVRGPRRRGRRGRRRRAASPPRSPSRSSVGGPRVVVRRASA